MKVVTENRKARHNYFIEEVMEAGIVLMGTEVKSLRCGRANLNDGYARVEGGEVVLHGLHISPYDQGNRFNHEPRRSRKLLLRREEIRRLIGKVQEKGMVLVPLKIYFNDRGLAKVELGLAKGKRLYDKRQALKEQEAQRDIARALRSRQGP